MNQKVLQTLEFHKITSQLSEHASSPLGKELCRALKPMDEINEIEQALAETSDALKRIWQKGSISFSGCTDVRSSLKRLEIGSILSQEELLHICALLEAVNRVKQYSRGENTEAPKDSLDDMFEELEPLTPLSQEIRRCILSEEEISDDASPGLKKVRREIRASYDKIHSQLTGMVGNSTTRAYLQDAVITQRNGRYCIPVKVEYRGQVPGMIHDQSSSGSTLFIEPMAVVKLNNDLKELSIREQEEIEKILAQLSQNASAYIHEIETDFQILTRLDFIFAKAQFSKKYKGSRPLFNTKGYIHIKDGRHPLLDPHSVVPVHIYLGDAFHLLIITGPNTGGKTVALKTIGLFTLMGQSGLHIPAFERSELALFHEVYADIGDEQSIEQSLSTFSSHMKKIVSILENADEHSLVLFDELGAGTDPVEGAALATSILSYLHSRKIRAAATTHYSELKVFALSTEGVENACCEFDVQTLRPTYRLLIGVPGKSNAFAISSKLGLPDFIIEDARKRISEQNVNFEDLITDLENSRTTIEKEREEIKQYKEEIRQLRNKLEQKQDKLEKRKETILREANEKAQGILQEAKDYADETIRKFNQFNLSAPSAKEMERERRELREKLSSVEKKLSVKAPQKKHGNYKPSDFCPGDSVRVISLNLEGIVNSKPNAKGELYVQMGILRSLIHIKDLEPIEEKTPRKEPVQKSNTGSIRVSKSATVSTEINLIGMTTDEAVAVLDKYLDDAYLAHVPSVRIVHGKGTGALRNAVHKHLKRLSYVKSFRLGVFGEGEAGVTIVEFN